MNAIWATEEFELGSWCDLDVVCVFGLLCAYAKTCRFAFAVLCLWWMCFVSSSEANSWQAPQGTVIHTKKNHMRRIRANIGAFRYEIYVLHSTITKIKYLISIFCVIRSAHCLRATRQTANNHICETHCATNGYFYSTLHATIYKEFVKCDWGLLVCLITMWTFAEKELNLD